jgi:hypothetical protein
MKKLPAPRLELKWKQATKGYWYNRVCIYSLILPLTKYDIRREGKNGKRVRSTIALEIGRTNVQGGRNEPPIYNGKVSTPFRDGAHAQWDSESLGNIPIYAVCGKDVTKIERNHEFIKSTKTIGV